MLSDLLFVCRSLIRNRGFALVTICTLAVGIGAATAIFSFTDYILFRTRSFPAGVYLVSSVDEHGSFLAVRFDYMVRAYQRSTGAVKEFALASQTTGNVVVDRQPVATSWYKISPNFFATIRVPLSLGRGFLASDSKPGATPVAIVSWKFWKSHLAGASDVLGRKITLGTALATVVGVLPEDPTLPTFFWADVYQPLEENPPVPPTPAFPQYWVLAKLLPGESTAQACDRLQMVQGETPVELRPFVGKQRITLASLSELNSRFSNTDAFWAMLGAVALLYAIACANASNLVLVRMLGRRRELSIRLALGGRAWRIVRLLVIESVLLSFLGAAGGFFIAQWIMPLLLRFDLGSLAVGLTLNWRAYPMLGALSVITSVLVVVVPAMRVLRADIHSGLKDGGTALGESRDLSRIRGALVILQTAMAIVLLCGAGLMVRTFENFEKVDLGFDPIDRVRVQLEFATGAQTGNEAQLARLREIRTLLEHIPGVRAAGFASNVLLPGYQFSQGEFITPDGRTVTESHIDCLGEQFQDAAGLRLLRGNWLTNRQGDHILVNATLAHAVFNDRDPVGQYLRPGQYSRTKAPKEWKGWRIDGVIGDLRPSMHDAAGMVIYGPQTWAPAMMTTFAVRLSRPFGPDIAADIRKRLYAFDPQMVVDEVKSLPEVRDEQLWAERTTNSILRVLSLSAAILTGVGIFSVLAYTVSQRTTEFGVRVALGASRRHLVSLVVRRGLMLALIGLAVGIGAALFFTRLLAHVIYGTSATDPLLLTGVSVVLIVTVVAACALPAYRASRADAARLLRTE